MNTAGAAEDWEALLHLCGDLEARVCADEASYLQRWSQNIAQQQDLGLMAVQGGLLADRMAWVFVAGYQAALRSTFADQNFTAWGAFAVSEDRRGDPPLPGVDYQQVNGEFVISGHKTWVATVNSVQHLVVKAGHGERALYFNLPRHTQGLEFSSRSANFLAEMSQGSAHLDEVTVPVDAVLDASVVAQFAAREALYIYLAFLAYAGRAWSHNHSSDECFLLIQRLRQALAEPSLPIAEVKAIDLGVQRVLAAISPAAGADNARWEKDQRLISMYSPGIQQRKA